MEKRKISIMRILLNKLISIIPYIRYAFFYRQNCNFRPGHFYSPVVDLEELQIRQNEIWKPRLLDGIEMNFLQQYSFLEKICKFNKVIPFHAMPINSQLSYFRYYFENKTYSYADGLVLFSMLQHYQPKRVIEVGSGFSSALMMDTNDLYRLGIEFTFIEPNPSIAVNKLFRAADLPKLMKAPVQQIDEKIFLTLQANDILFIDGSHVSKTGSDVNYLLTEILPILNKGVIIHIHDIFYPFEYPKEWLFDLRWNWNEIYAVHNFLLFNNAFEILFFSDFIWSTKKEYKNEIPLFFKDRPASLWIRKIL